MDVLDQKNQNSINPISRGRLTIVAAAVLSAASPPVYAGVLDGVTAIVTPSDPSESWTLLNGAQLDVQGGMLTGFTTIGSTVNLNSAMITSPAATSFIYEGSTVNVTGSTLLRSSANNMALGGSGALGQSLTPSTLNIADSTIRTGSGTPFTCMTVAMSR